MGLRLSPLTGVKINLSTPLLHHLAVNIIFRIICAVLAAFYLSGCTSTPPQSQAEDITSLRETYCDSYLVYDMCVRDVNADGIADLMYFEDTGEVFMLTSEMLRSPSHDFSLHRCVQTMDDATQAASTDLLEINEHTGVMKKTQLKSKLMLAYMHYYNDIQSCMNGHTVADRSDSKDSFGEDDNWGEDEFEEL